MHLLSFPSLSLAECELLEGNIVFAISLLCSSFSLETFSRELHVHKSPFPLSRAQALWKYSQSVIYHYSYNKRSGGLWSQPAWIRISTTSLTTYMLWNSLFSSASVSLSAKIVLKTYPSQIIKRTEWARSFFKNA